MSLKNVNLLIFQFLLVIMLIYYHINKVFVNWLIVQFLLVMMLFDYYLNNSDVSLSTKIIPYSFITSKYLIINQNL